MLKELVRLRQSCGPLGMLVVLVQRFGHTAVTHRVAPAVWLYRALDLLVVRICANAQMPAEAKIGRGVGFPHDANGVILSPSVVVGDGCVIYHQVTLGVVNGKEGAPTLGQDVFVGAGAKILGPVKVGDGAKVGANAVVLHDVPPGATVVGVPARPPR